jgi:hypothetical protein
LRWRPTRLYRDVWIRVRVLMRLLRGLRQLAGCSCINHCVRMRRRLDGVGSLDSSSWTNSMRRRARADPRRPGRSRDLRTGGRRWCVWPTRRHGVGRPSTVRLPIFLLVMTRTRTRMEEVSSIPTTTLSIGTGTAHPRPTLSHPHSDARDLLERRRRRDLGMFGWRGDGESKRWISRAAGTRVPGVTGLTRGMTRLGRGTALRGRSLGRLGSVGWRITGMMYQKSYRA